MEKKRTYIAIDLKSFYASVECQERGLDPLDVNLVVADESRTDKTICLAVSPALKKLGVPSRPRLFEVRQKVKEINRQRRNQNHGYPFSASSLSARELERDSSLKLEFLAAVPRMATYIEYSTRINSIYSRYISPEDIHIYSIDEVFIDATDYLKLYQLDAVGFARKLIHEVMRETGITATAGIGPNMYLCKVAMDVIAKHIPADEYGVRIAEIDELSYRQKLWTHRPLTDFWRVGIGTARKLEANGLYTMGDIARCSIGSFHDRYNEDFLYQLFGVNAELLIDHAWGYEPCTMADVKAYKPEASSTGIGQVLHKPYDYEGTQIIVKEMAEELAMQLLKKKKMTKEVALYVGYDITSMNSGKYNGEVVQDFYGRIMPKPQGGKVRFGFYTDSRDLIVSGLSQVLEKNTDHSLFVRRINVTALDIQDREKADTSFHVQENLFEMMDEKTQLRIDEERKGAMEKLKKERQIQETIALIRERYGKNVVFKAMDKQEGATVLERNQEIGGHKA